METQPLNQMKALEYFGTGWHPEPASCGGKEKNETRKSFLVGTAGDPRERHKNKKTTVRSGTPRLAGSHSKEPGFETLGLPQGDKENTSQPLERNGPRPSCWYGPPKV